MTATVSSTELSKAFLRALDQAKPLDYSVEEQRKLYVPSLHGEADILLRLAREIDSREGQGMYLFTGQIGSGKSTELYRLKHLLETHNGCKVFYCDLEQWLNPQLPVELGSFLVAVVASWIEQSTSLLSQRTALERLFDFFKSTNITVDKLELGTDIGAAKVKLQFALSSDDSFITSVQTALTENKSRFVAQVHSFVEKLFEDTCPPHTKCVLLVDSLEKVRGFGSNADAVFDSVQNLFTAQGHALQLPLVHVVYSISPFVFEQNPQIPSQLGNAIAVNLPSVHIYQEKSDVLDEAGVARMQAVLTHRFSRWEHFFTPAQVRQVVEHTGGDLRDFLRALRAALLSRKDYEQARVDDEALAAAFNQLRPTMSIPSEHISWMQALQTSHTAELAGKEITPKLLDRYLTTKHVLAYINGSTWYSVHPLIRAAVAERAQAIAVRSASEKA